MAEGVCVVVDILQAQRWYLMRAMKTRGDSCVNVSMQEPKHAGFYSDRPRDQPSSHQQVMQIISPDSNDMRVLSPLKKILGELPLCCWWTLLVTSASNTETNKSHWKIMVEFKSTHSKSQISDVKKKKALTNWDTITATLRSVLLNPPLQAMWLARAGTVLLEKQRN